MATEIFSTEAVELCKIAITAMKDAKGEYLNTVYSTIASLVIAIGWILTSDHARNYLAEHGIIKKVTAGATVFFCAFHISNLSEIVGRANEIKEKTSKLCTGIDQEILTVYTVLDHWPEWSITFNTILFLGFFLMVCLSQKTDPNEKRSSHKM